jgi:hypothetical protein
MEVHSGRAKQLAQPGSKDTKSFPDSCERLETQGLTGFSSPPAAPRPSGQISAAEATSCGTPHYPRFEPKRQQPYSAITTHQTVTPT